MGMLRVVRCAAVLTGLAGVLPHGATAQHHSGAAIQPPRSSIRIQVTSARMHVVREGYVEVRGVIVVIDATRPWQLLVRAEAPDSTVSLRITEVHGPARMSGRDFRLVMEATPVASGDAGTGIELFFDYTLPVGTSPSTVSYTLVSQ